ncbi:cytochrome P450 [Saccharothrix violaceirubra]|uniref:Cytochrome P450 n=1 Tax=Saccharothrix violaceirubra TaxID=413306 RepID=A0A7W7T485_9PSEU|nr:cytochrome P450 [Saccharothrix violaceirubra]MBB4966280.1 cytochrome P450 [Saccharothrix violaceirubra]
MTVPLFDVADWPPARLADPYPVYRRYREHDPVHRGVADTWYLFRHDDVVRVLTDDGFGRSAHAVRAPDGGTVPPIPPDYDRLRRVVANWLVFLDPPRHRRLRALVSRAFTADTVHALRPRIAEIARGLVRAMRDRPVVDLVEEFAAPLPILVIAELLGVPAHDAPWFRERAVALQEAGGTRTSRRADAYALAEEAAGQLADYFLRGHDRGLVALLARAGLTEDEFTGTCVHLLTAGHETTTNLIGKSVLALLANPSALDGRRAPTTGEVDELIRYDAPVQMVTRWAYRDTVLRGRGIHRGDKVVAVLGSANRDPCRFPDPDVLRLDRTGPAHRGFGMGIHYCLGAALARAEAEIGLGALLAGNLLAGSAFDVRYGADLVFHGPTRLMLRTTPQEDA